MGCFSPVGLSLLICPMEPKALPGTLAVGTKDNIKKDRKEEGAGERGTVRSIRRSKERCGEVRLMGEAGEGVLNPRGRGGLIHLSCYPPARPSRPSRPPRPAPPGG